MTDDINKHTADTPAPQSIQETTRQVAQGAMPEPAGEPAQTSQVSADVETDVYPADVGELGFFGHRQKDAEYLQRNSLNGAHVPEDIRFRELGYQTLRDYVTDTSGLHAMREGYSLVDKLPTAQQLSDAAQGLPGVSVSAGSVEPDPLPQFMPEISGDIPVYTDGRINLRNTPGQGWSADWLWQGERAWVPLARLPRETLVLIHEHLKDQRYFPREAASWAAKVMSSPPAGSGIQVVTPRGTVTLPDGGGTVTVDAQGRATTYPAAPKQQPYRNPKRASKKAQKALRVVPKEYK